MKKTITLMSLLISTMSFAQNPTIQAANQIPAIGDTIFYKDANTFGFDPNGSGGAINVVWNFTGLESTSSLNFFYVDPTLTPETDSFPSANMAQGNSLAAGYEYFENDASSINRWGYSSPSSSLYYNNSFARYTFPITPGQIQSQSYTGRMTSLGAGEDSVTIDNGNYQANPDAFGTVSLPPLVFGGQPEVFDSVVRVHVTESFVIKAWAFGTTVVSIAVTDDYYFFFDNLTQEPIVIYGVTTDDQGSAPITVLRYQATAGTGTGGSSSIEELNDASFSLFPNPTSSQVNVSFNDSKERRISLISLDGKIIETMNTSSLTASFEVSELNSGTYFVEVTTNGVKSMKRVIVK